MASGLIPPAPPFQYPVSWGPDMPPDHQAVWALKVALAYFFIGLGSMIIAVTALNDSRIAVTATGNINPLDSIRDVSKFKLSLGLTSLITVLLGLVLLVLDAGKPATAWEIITYGIEYGRWESWMFLGTIFLSVLVLVILIYIGIWLGGINRIFSKLTSWYIVKGGFYYSRYVLIALALIFGILGASYGGVLFSLTNVALWRNPIIVILFPVSGLSSAAAVGMILTFLIKDVNVRESNLILWSTIDLFSEIGEAILTALFLYIGILNPNSVISVQQVLYGRYSAYFWTLVVTLGLAIPMLLEIVMHKISPYKYKYIVPIITILVLIGAASLRYYVVIASAYYYSPLSPFTPIQLQFPWGTTWGE